MTKWIFSISAFGFMLLFFACGIAEKPASTPTSWTSEQCDTTLRFERLEAIDLVLPFSQLDSLKNLLVAVPQVFMAILKEGQIQQSSAISATSFKGLPFVISAHLDLPQADTLTWLDRAYLWTLADRPDYPYDRYQPLLKDIRNQFLAKRDSMVQTYQRKQPKYKLRVQSDLRGSGYQRRHLTMGKSMSPLSQHNFGLASDIAIVYKGRQLQSIKFYKDFLGEVGNQYGLTWGGTFLGFIDPNHVQYFKRTSDMLEQFPALRFEYEPYLRYFKNRVQRMTAAGKAAKVEDTKALLFVLHALHKGKTCVCDTLAERPTPPLLVNLLPQFKTFGYHSSQDILLIGDLDSQTVTLFHPTGVQKTVRLGRWK